jgi:hypothetical protein
MRFFIWLMILLASAIGLAVLARFNPGNVVLFYPPYRVDFSLNFFRLTWEKSGVSLLRGLNYTPIKLRTASY